MSKNDEDKEEDLHMEKITDDNIKGHKYLFRICLIGNASVGKTSLLKTYTSNPFQNKYMPQQEKKDLNQYLVIIIDHHMVLFMFMILLMLILLIV